MNHFDVGLDKGRSKTNLAVARADGHLLLQARIAHYDQFDPQPITESRLLHLIAQHLTPFKAHPLSLFMQGRDTSTSYKNYIQRIRSSILETKLST